MIGHLLVSPLGAGWTPQYMRLHLRDVTPGAPLALTIDGMPTPFQYTGGSSAAGAEIVVKLGFRPSETKRLRFDTAGASSTDLVQRLLPMNDVTVIGHGAAMLAIGTRAPFLGFSGFPMTCTLHSEGAFEGAELRQCSDGPLFTDYALGYRYADNRRYDMRFRCYKDDSFMEVHETFSLRMGAALTWTLNPSGAFTHILSRDSFEGENQPSTEPLGADHPGDVLCRLQMPVLCEYFIPNNRGWFALYAPESAEQRMVGVLGLSGAQWQEPVANMPEILDRAGTVEWHAALESGSRHWLLYAGPVETTYTPERRFVFHRLHAEFNALRLDEHMDLADGRVADASLSNEPCIFGEGDFHDAARRRHDAYPCLQAFPSSCGLTDSKAQGLYLANSRYLLDPTDANAAAVQEHLETQFARWVRQFQGYRTGHHDYQKNTIGFSRYLRGMLMGYEMLRRDKRLCDVDSARFEAYFVFAARRILDEGRWPHSRTWLHPDHPESVRDMYTYGGEHKPDRLVWTNNLPNFQSDPMCALAHVAAVFKDHPDARRWLHIALDELDRQLDAYCGKSGAWVESINYALYTFSYFIITFKAVLGRWKINYFTDPRMRRFVGWLCRFFGPLDKRFGVHTMPGVGNAIVPQTGGELLLCYAGELAEDDPLRADCLAVWQRAQRSVRLSEHYPVVVAAMAPLPAPVDPIPLRVLESECMDEVGAALRHRHTQPDESYLFQKIGFAKDHYEADETAFNWYAKGTPFCMDYGTYTADVATAAAHNLVEIPDADPLRRGYLADHCFTPSVDYTRCEVPVTLKLLWGHVRTFAEVDGADSAADRTKTPYFYVGDDNPVGPKVWKIRQMLFVKPDYVMLFDRVYGQVSHRYNLHLVGDNIRRDGATIAASGRFDLDPLVYVQHPATFTMETGEFVPKIHAGCGGTEVRQRHAQHFLRLYNETDGIYRTVIFARERQRAVTVETCSEHGVRIETPDYVDYAFLHNETVEENLGDVRFVGRAGWIRRHADGRIEACVPDGEVVTAFGLTLTGRHSWSYGAGN